MKEKKEFWVDNDKLPAVDYDGAFKNFLANSSDTQLVELINGVFERKYPPDSVVERPNTETYENGGVEDTGERIGDYRVKIGSDMFIFEIQSNDEDEMAFRIFEYSIRSTMQYGRSDDTAGVLKMRMPNPVVIYLRTSSRTPREFQIEVEIPNIIKIEGNKVTYSVPAMRINDYTPEQLGEKGMAVALPFYTMNFRTVTEKNVDEFLEAYKNAINEAQVLNSEKKITDFQFAEIIANLDTLSERIISKSDPKRVNMEEVSKFMENVRDLPCVNTFVWTKGLYNMGIEKGRKEGSNSIYELVVDRLIDKNIPISEIADVLAHSEEEVVDFIKEHLHYEDGRLLDDKWIADYRKETEPQPTYYKAPDDSWER
jgi:hypothetical protein